MLNPDGTVSYGRAKLGVYRYWTCSETKVDPTQAEQFEFYNYNARYTNFGEVGNGALTGPNTLNPGLPTTYLNNLNAIATGGLYSLPAGTPTSIVSASTAAKAEYITFLGSIVKSCGGSGKQDPPD